jgi:hypothetical protein
MENSGITLKPAEGGSFELVLIQDWTPVSSTGMLQYHEKKI